MHPLCVLQWDLKRLTFCLICFHLKANLSVFEEESVQGAREAENVTRAEWSYQNKMLPL